MANNTVSAANSNDKPQAPLSNKELELEQLMTEYTAATIEYGRYSLLYEQGGYYAGPGTESASMADARKKAEKLKYQIRNLAHSLPDNEASEPPNQ